MVPPPASLALNQLSFLSVLAAVAPNEKFIPVVLTAHKISNLPPRLRVQLQSLERQSPILAEMQQKTVLVLVHQANGQESTVFVVVLLRPRQRHAVQMRVVAALCDETGQARPPLVAATHAPQSLRDLLALRTFGEEGESAVRDQFSPGGGERAEDVHPFILANILEHSVLSVFAADRAVSGLSRLALMSALVALPANLSPLLEGRIVAIFVDEHRAAIAGEPLLAVALGHLEVAGRAEHISLFDSFGFLLSLHYVIIITRAPIYFFGKGDSICMLLTEDWRPFNQNQCKRSARWRLVI